MRALASAAFALVMAGCYSPATPAGAYSCGTNGACPDGQHCTCGQCVGDDSEAACALTAVAMLPTCPEWPPGEQSSPPKTCVYEHQAFPVAVTALRADKKTTAVNYHGGVEVSSSWGDATLTRDPIVFSNGTAKVMVSLNRETVGSVGARLTFRAGTAGATTASRIPVLPPHWKLDPQAALAAPSGWADLVAAEPAVVRAGPSDYRMYFTGVGVHAAGGFEQGIGVATSTDKQKWTVHGDAVLKVPVGGWAMRTLTGPAAFAGTNGEWRLLFKGDDTVAYTDPMTHVTAMIEGPASLGLAISGDGLANFALAGASQGVSHNPVLAGCNFCAPDPPAVGIDSPSILPFSDGTPGAFELYFTTQRRQRDGSLPPGVGHAITLDYGATWDVDPYSVLAANSDEYLFAPRVFIDGSVYKMFYAEVKLTGVPDFHDFAVLCTGAINLTIAYATSSDGLYWVRSLANPAFSAPAWGGGHAIIPGTPVLIDPSDPTQGYDLWFTVFQSVTLPVVGKVCLPNGIGHATRP